MNNGSHQVWTFPAEKMIPVEEVRKSVRPPEWPLPTGTRKEVKKRHRKRSRRWLNQMLRSELDMI